MHQAEHHHRFLSRVVRKDGELKGSCGNFIGLSLPKGHKRECDFEGVSLITRETKISPRLQQEVET